MGAALLPRDPKAGAPKVGRPPLSRRALFVVKRRADCVVARTQQLARFGACLAGTGISVSGRHADVWGQAGNSVPAQQALVDVAL